METNSWYSGPVIQAATALLDADPAKQQRKHPRHRWERTLQACMLTAACTPTTPVFVRSLDLSQDGCSFLCRISVHVGTLGVLLLVTDQGGPQLRCFEVRNVRYVSNMVHLAGVCWHAMPEGLAIPVRMTGVGPRLFVDADEAA